MFAEFDKVIMYLALELPSGIWDNINEKYRKLKSAISAIQEEAEKSHRLHGELLSAVGKKFPNETRHETALRYIREAENSCSDPGNIQKNFQIDKE